jgi:hypothetical protein
LAKGRTTQNSSTESATIVVAAIPRVRKTEKQLQEVMPCSTMSPSLLLLAESAVRAGRTRMVTESMSDYWKPVFYLLEALRFATGWSNAKDVKHL